MTDLLHTVQSLGLHTLSTCARRDEAVNQITSGINNSCLFPGQLEAAALRVR